MNTKPRTQEDTSDHTLAKEIGAALDVTVFSAYNIGLAWMIAFTRAEKPAKEADSPL